MIVLIFESHPIGLVSVLSENLDRYYGLLLKSSGKKHIFQAFKAENSTFLHVLKLIYYVSYRAGQTEVFLGAEVVLYILHANLYYFSKAEYI